MFYDCSAVLRKFKQGQRGVLQPKLGQKHPLFCRNGPALSSCLLLETVCVWEDCGWEEGSDGFSRAAESFI